MAMLTCRVSDELMSEILKEMAETGKGKTEVITQALEEYLGRGSENAEPKEVKKKPAARAKKAKAAPVEPDPLAVALEAAASGGDVLPVVDSPQYQRPRHDPATCRIHKCGMCVAAKV